MDAVERMKTALEHKDQPRIPRGEFWLGSRIFHEPRFHGEDSLQTHVQLCREMKMDFLSLPVDMPTQIQANYRRFNMDEIGQAVANSGLFTCVVVDGPLQQSAERPGDLSSLSPRPNDSRSARLREEASIIEGMIAALAGRGVNAVVIADDIAYRRSTYASPQTLREHLFPLYAKMVDRIHGRGAYALFHSDGDIALLIPDLIACGFDGLAGCEPECLDLASLKETYGCRITLITGIRAELLEPGSPTLEQGEGFVAAAQALAQRGGFVLCSACGVNSREAVESLKTLYRWVDEET